MPPVNRARSRAVRALLSALAGGGLTAAGLGGPLTAPALGASITSGNQSSAEGGGGSQQTETGETSTTTTSTETTTQPETTTTPPLSTPTTTATTPPATSTSPAATVPTATTPQASEPSLSAAPTVVLKRKRQKPSASAPSNPSQTITKAGGKSGKASGPNGVASSPQTVAAEAGALAAMLASSEASAQALSFYRIPLFLLPIYKAAAVQYGVPWQILAAINEIETDYGTDLSVSTAGAVGWMQFEPSTWLQYGVDALNAGYADPYNPVDAIFAAARYLRAAGAATNLRDAILAYNHSEEYVESVLLRAKLISTYPKAVIATLTGLIDGRLPVTGHHVAWTPLAITAPSPSTVASPSTATAGAVGAGAADASANVNAAAPSAVSPAAQSPAVATAATPGSTPPLSPTQAAAAATPHAHAAAAPLQLVDLMSAPNASVVAVQDGRIMQIGDSRKLGKYVVLRDVYGDVFTYAGLGSIAPTYVLPKTPRAQTRSTVVEAASTRASAPSQPASAGTQSQSPLTLQVKAPKRKPATAGSVSVQADTQEVTPPGMDRVRLFAHPGNPDARAAAVASAARKARSDRAGQRLPLRRGSVVASGTVLGRVRVPPNGKDGHLRFAIRPAGDAETINPGPVLANWAQLQSALHPQGARAENALLGATASDVFLLSKAQLERAVLAEPGITLDACSRHEVAAGMVDRRALAVLAFLSRSGLEPTVSAVRCSQRQYASANAGDELDITAINGTAIAGHQGPETITDLTIRTLLTLPAQFVPHQIDSLMRFPGSSRTHASRAYANRIHLVFRPLPATPALSAAAASTVAHSASSGRTAPSPLVTTSVLTAAQWNQLMQRVSALPAPKIAAKPTSAAIPDPKRR